MDGSILWRSKLMANPKIHNFHGLKEDHQKKLATNNNGNFTFIWKSNVNKIEYPRNFCWFLRCCTGPFLNIDVFSKQWSRIFMAHRRRKWCLICFFLVLCWTKIQQVVVAHGIIPYNIFFRTQFSSLGISINKKS